MSPTYRILIAEDDSVLLPMFVRVTKLCYPSAQVQGVCDGLAALQAHTQQPADLLITDYHMPAMTGLLLIRTLRTQAVTIPILSMSGDHTNESLLRQAGATAYLPIPFSVLAFKHTVYSLLAPYSTSDVHAQQSMR